jgi:hypothetical protein
MQGMAHFVTDEKIKSIAAEILPYRQGQDSLLHIEHRSLSRRIMLNGNVLSSHQFG